jgi:hypothetical protein
MLSYPFFWCEDEKLFSDDIKNQWFVFPIFEPKRIFLKVEFLHGRKGRKKEPFYGLGIREGFLISELKTLVHSPCQQ